MLEWTKKATLITFLVLVAVVTYINFKMIGPYLLSIAMGGVLALLMEPLYRRIRRKLSPRLASAVTCLVLILVVLVPLGLFTAMAVDQGISFAQSISLAPGQTFHKIVDRAMRWRPMQELFGSPEAIAEQMRSAVQRLGKGATSVVLSIAAGFPNLVLDLVIAVITCFFLLSDGKAFLEWIRDKIPMEEEVRERVYTSLRNTAVSVIWAGVAASLAQAVLLFLAFVILRVPAAFLAGGATFITAWIPVVGSSPVWIAGAIYLFAQKAFVRMAIMIAIGLSIGIVDNVVRSMVLGGRSEMHPLISLIAIFGGVQMFGIAGVFLGPILAAVLIALLQVWPAVGNRSGLAERKEMVVSPKRRA